MGDGPGFLPASCALRNLKLALNGWHCLSPVLLSPASQRPTGLAQEGTVGFYDSASFPVARLFPVTPAIIYLFVCLLDACG